MKLQRITIEQYIAERLDTQIAYYSNAATAAKHKFQRTKVVEIILAASVPLFSALITQANADTLKIVVGVIGVSISILSGMLLLFKFDENWVTYRTTAEALKSEKYLFLTRSGTYKGKQASMLFIERVEQILDEEHSKWQSYVLQGNDNETEVDAAVSEAEALSTQTFPVDPTNPNVAPSVAAAPVVTDASATPPPAAG
jgi:Protein of unknown function (DUF4231)